MVNFLICRKILWEYNNSKLWNDVTYAFYEFGILYIDVIGILEALNIMTGKILWRIGYHHWIGVTWENHFYMPQPVNHTNTFVSVRIYAINLKTGKEV
ncbi:hypothetical protein B6U71_00465 [Euryarchaeota archaeon ex4484_178]|nr:MAG: hypothetical protein B6U71_00465 [Euryarchaeota archaeon ex4484_178]